jgi:transposase
VIAPSAHQVAQLDEIPGNGVIAAQELIAEIGVGMTRFPSAGHLVSWAKYAPKARESAGKSKPGTTGKGNPWLALASPSARPPSGPPGPTFPGSRYHRLARGRGKQRALVAAGNSILTIAHHLLSDPDARFTDLGPDWHDRLSPIRRKRQLITELERLSGKRSSSKTRPPDPSGPEPGSAGRCRAGSGPIFDSAAAAPR